MSMNERFSDTAIAWANANPWCTTVLAVWAVTTALYVWVRTS